MVYQGFFLFIFVSLLVHLSVHWASKKIMCKSQDVHVHAFPKLVNFFKFLVIGASMCTRNSNLDYPRLIISYHRIMMAVEGLHQTDVSFQNWNIHPVLRRHVSSG